MLTPLVDRYGHIRDRVRFVKANRSGPRSRNWLLLTRVRLLDHRVNAFSGIGFQSLNDLSIPIPWLHHFVLFKLGAACSYLSGLGVQFVFVDVARNVGVHIWKTGRARVVDGFRILGVLDREALLRWQSP